MRFIIQFNADPYPGILSIDNHEIEVLGGNHGTEAPVPHAVRAPYDVAQAYFAGDMKGGGDGLT